MRRVGVVSIAVIFSLFSTILTQQDLKCWRCDSKAEFCNDPFDSSKLNAAEKLNLYGCSNGRCVKTISNDPTEGRLVTRTCVDSEKAAQEYCNSAKFTFCEACATDECNGAAKYGPLALLAALPVAIARIVLI